MGRGAVQVVMGPAGSGKSTYCQVMQEHCQTLAGSRRRNVLVANLDPAADHINYDCAVDIRDLINVDDVMEELGLGPNGGLVYCMEYLLANLDWLKEQMESGDDSEDYWLLDCPGQIELYTHVPIMRTLLDRMQTNWGLTGILVSVFCIDSSFCCDANKFLSGQLLALSAMISMELPHINVLTKGDLLPEEDLESMLSIQNASQLWGMEMHRSSLLTEEVEENIAGWKQKRAGTKEKQQGADEEDDLAMIEKTQRLEARRRKRYQLTESICSLLDDYTMVSFVPMNIQDEESIDHVLNTVDHSIQYGEDAEVGVADFDVQDPDE